MIKTYLFPGLGADTRMYTHQTAEFPSIKVIEWADHLPGGTIDEFAARIAGSLPQVRPLVLAGSSFGGFVAWELAKYLRPQAVVLLGSASTPRALRQPLRLLLPMAHLVPAAAHSAAKVSAPLVAPIFGARNRADRTIFSVMMRATSSTFISWATRAIAEWKPSLNQGIPIFRLHGKNDRIISPPADQSACIINDAGHLPTVTHPEKVNAFLCHILESLQSNAER